MGRLTFFLAAVLLVLLAQEALCRELTFSIDPNDRNALRYSDMRVEEADPQSITTGRFLSVDPIWESADLAAPQSWNRYSYVRNNPIGNTDPDDRICVPCAGVGSAIGGLVAVGRESYRQVRSNQPVDNARLLKAFAVGAALGGAIGAAAPAVYQTAMLHPQETVAAGSEFWAR